MTETELVTLARNGDADAFAGLMTRYQGRIYAHAYRMTGDADVATDITQETFVRAHTALPKLTTEPNLQAWLYRVAGNLVIDRARRERLRRWLPWSPPHHDHLAVVGPPERPEEEALHQERRRLVQQTLLRMSAKHRQVLLLREYEGLSCAEIGAVLGLSRSAVKSRLFRAREEFRQAWAEMGNGEVLA